MKSYHFFNIVIWLLIFIIGSLIVSFLIYPETFQSFKSNIKNIITSTSSNLNTNPNINKVKLVPSEMEEYGLYGSYYKSCVNIEAIGESEGVTDLKEKACIEACAKRNMDYSSDNCEKDLLVCYCKDEN
jgi:hypothetical protein